jgi:hypothetical protein
MLGLQWLGVLGAYSINIAPERFQVKVFLVKEMSRDENGGSSHLFPAIGSIDKGGDHGLADARGSREHGSEGSPVAVPHRVLGDDADGSRRLVTDERAHGGTRGRRSLYGRLRSR